MLSTRKYELYSKEFQKHSHAIFAEMRAEAPIVKQPGIDGETPIWYVTRYADVQQILLDDKHFVRDPRLAFPPEDIERMDGRFNRQIDEMLNNHMLNRDGEAHRRLRSIVSKAFTPKVIQSMRPRIEKIANDLLDKVVSNGRMELVSDYAFPLPITVIAEMLGIPLENQNQFRKWSNAFVSPAITAEQQQESIPLLLEFAAYMQQLVAERRRQPENDLLSGLIHAEENGDRLSEGELFSMLSLLIVAGHETTVSLLGNAVLALLQHPDTLQQIKNDPTVIPSAVEEILRYDAPVERAITRFVTKDLEFGGQQFKRGDLVIVVLGSANRDEAQFKSPDTLDIHRQQNPHIAFGKGVHYCLGAPLARLEGEIALRVLFDRIPDLTLDIDPDDLEWRDVPIFHSLVRLPVKWKSGQ